MKLVFWISFGFKYVFFRDPSTKAKKKPAKKGKKKAEDDEDDESEEEDEEAEEEQGAAEEGGSLAPEYARKSGKHKGSNAGLKAFVIAQVGRGSTNAGKH